VEQYQRDQLQLQQYYQQQRIMELQMARQRQMEMEAQNSTRFTQMRDRAYAAIAPMGGYDPSHMGFMGRNIGLAGANGVARQSLFGTIADRSFTGGGFFFRRAGFQFNMREAEVRERARQSISVLTGQMGNVALNAITPDILQRQFNMIGMGNIQERSLMVSDAFSGLRGASADLVSGRGLGLERSAEITEQLTRRMNRMSGGRLNEDQIDSLTEAALAGMTSRQMAQASARGTDGVVDMLAKMVKQLETVSKNTGISSDKMTQLVVENRGMGNDVSDLFAISGMVNRSLTSTTVNREAQMRMALGFTAQGRQMGLADARSFGTGMLQDINNLVDAFNAGTVSKAELFQFGGDGEFDAASRVASRRMQAGQVFAQQQSGLLGVLGTRGMRSLQGGLLNFTGDVASAYASNPFAGLMAEADPAAQQRLIENGGRAALQMAENEADMYGNLSPEQRRAVVARRFGQLTGRSTIDAVREIGRMRGQGRVIDAGVDAFNPGGRMGARAIDKAAMKDRLRAGMGTFRIAGISLDQMTSEEFLRTMDMNPEADAAELVRKFTLGPEGSGLREAREKSLRDLMNQKDSKLSLLSLDDAAQSLFGVSRKDAHTRFLREKFGEGYASRYGGASQGRVRQTARAVDNLRIDASFSGSALFDTINRNDVLTDNMLRQIYMQDASDGVQNFSSIEEVRELMRSEEGRRQVAAGMSEEGRQYLAQVAKNAIINEQTRANLEGVELGSSPMKPVYVRNADTLFG